jgi:RND superfamily putative drug exporter
VSGLLARLGGAAAAHPWRTIGAWLVLLAAAIGLAATVGGSPHDDYNVKGSPSQAGTDFLTENFPEHAGTDARVVVHRDRPLDAADLTALTQRLGTLHGVSHVDAPRLSADGDTALVGVQYDIPVTDFEGTEGVDALRSATAPLERAGYTVDLGGQIPENIGEPSGVAEAVGILAALVILVIAFGSVVAAGLPLAVALIGLGVGSAGITLLAAFIDVSTIAPTIASMVGIGVGIDYALLLVTRHVEGLRAGLSVRDAAARANATAGLSVVFAGTTVFASLLGLRLAGLSTYATSGYATLIVVLAVMLTAVTLVPALCGLAGLRVLRKRQRAAVRSSSDALVTDLVVVPETPAATSTRTRRWAERVGRRPLPWALAALLGLLVLAAPVLDMRTWPQDAGSQPTSDTTRRAYDRVAAEFGPGANGPFVIAVDLAKVPAAQLPALARELAAVPGVAGVTPPVVDDAGNAGLLMLEPSTGPQDERTPALLDRLRSDVLPDGTMVTGLTPVFADISQRLADRLWLVVAFVVGLSLLLLTAVFRSIVVAAKAAVMNLLSVAAAYGVMVAVFQWGWGAELLGLPGPVPVSSWVPILMFTILFGLSMDYEVFLLSRIREDWLATGDPHGSVVRGLAATGRVITSAAAIMIAVFVGFGLDPNVTVKMMGVGMAVAVLLDATIVRMVLVPSTMSLLGRANWYLPRWLDRALPHLDVEGRAPATSGPVAESTAPARAGEAAGEAVSSGAGAGSR